MTEPGSAPPTPGDNPINDRTADRLGRADFATMFAADVLELDASRGMVVAVVGPWGSGKTSFLNMCRHDWESSGAAVLEFNPWMFASTDQLVAAFFAEVSSQLKERRPRLEAIADGLADYGEAFSGLAWLPVVGTWIERGRLLTRGAARIAGRKGGTAARRDDLTTKLGEIETPVIVVLDDIDRLSNVEIREVFRLVRLTASFPNIVYVLAFDRQRVEHALSEDGVPGSQYLEKILQVSYDLPAVRQAQLQRELLRELERATTGRELLPLDDDAWPDIFVEVVAPLVHNMRDVRRLGLALQGSSRVVGTDVALADFLALEAVRVLDPALFSRLAAAEVALTAARDGLNPDTREAALRDEIAGLSGPDGSNARQARAVIERLFPMALRHIGGSAYAGDFRKGWLRKRRVAHSDVFNTYLARRPTETLETFRQAETAFAYLADREKLDTFLRRLPIEQVDEVIEALEAWEDEYPSEAVVSALIVLLNLLPDLPERNRGMFDFGTRVRVGRVIYRLARSLGDPDRVMEAVREVLPEVSTLSSRLELITDVGWKKNAGHKLISEADAATLEAELRNQALATDPRALAGEWNLLRVVYEMIGPDAEADSGRGYVVPSDPDLALAILRAARSSNRSQTVGSRAVREQPVLHWNMLTTIFGSDEQLAARIAQARTVQTADDGPLFELADRYLEGWRPRQSSFDDED